MTVPLSELIPVELMPVEKLVSAESLSTVLDRVLVTEFETQPLIPGPGDQVALGLDIAGEVVLNFPGLDGVGLVLGGQNMPKLEITAHAAPGNVQVRVHGGARIRFPRDWLRPVTKQDGKWVDDPSHAYSEIDIAADILIDQNWTIAFDGANEFSLSPAMLADTGFIIEGKVAVDLSESQSLPETKEMDLGNTWRGVVFKTITVHFPNDLDVPTLPEDLILTKFHIGSGGLSGSVKGNWSPTITGSWISGSGAGTLFGIPFGLKNLELTLLQNAITGLEIEGIISLPYFDQTLGVNVGLDLDGNFSLSMDSSTGLPDFTMKSGAVELMQVKVERLTVEHFEGVLSVGIGGTLTPRFGGLNWPTFDIKELAIDSNGNVHLDGGWLNLREQYSLDFYGFKIEITKLGFGKTEDGGKWIGFSGAVKLVDGLPAGASVEGLRIIWYDDKRSPRITLNGIGIEFEVPGTLRFKGAVSYRELPDKVHRFDGDIKLELTTLNLELDAKLVIGSAEGYNFFAIYLGLELPVGIPLWSTGLALYGMAGLFALQMTPGKKEDEAWYGIDKSKSWYHHDPIGVTSLTKWENKADQFALGAGITLGTVGDNGYTFSGKMLLAIVLSGPIIFIEGKANILRKRSYLDEEPIFRALVVLDGRAGTFLIGLDAQYKFGSGGELLEIGGSAEVLFSFTDPSLWHIYLGMKEPPEKRIRARIFKLFEANSYWMLDINQLAFGSRVGYGNSWKFGSVRITLEAWMETNVAISWNPPHFHGDLWLHGKAALKIWWFGFGLGLDGRLAGDIFDPFHILASLSVEIDLPWPLPDFSIGLTLEWGPEKDRPPLPVPLKEIAIAHPKVTTAWPLPRGQLLLPNYEQGGQGLLQDPIPTQWDVDSLPDRILIPIVPLDCRPQITFTRAVNDDAKVGINPQPQLQWEQIGDPAKNPPQGPARLRYALKALSLDKWNPVSNQWNVDSTKLYGAWAPVPGAGNTVAQTKLLLWSKTPFDYTRHSGSAWEEWFTARFSDYPCIPIPPDETTCYDFDDIDTTQDLVVPWSHPDESGLVFQWKGSDAEHTELTDGLGSTLGHQRALCLSATINLPGGQITQNVTTIDLPQPAKKVTLVVYSEPGVDVSSYAPDGTPMGISVHSGTWEQPSVVLVGGNIAKVEIRGTHTIWLAAICITIGLDDADILQRQEMSKHLVDETARWQQTGNVLQPDTIYRLKVVTEIQVEGEKELAGWNETKTQTEYVYFRTEGPPGLARLSIPLSTRALTSSEEEEVALRDPDGKFKLIDGNDEEKLVSDLTDKQGRRAVLKSDLNDLTLYVQQTVPATMPAKGQQPQLPRPVYRAYDVGVEFNEDYVDLLYRLERRDLGLYMFDNNNRPVRDAQGRLIILSNQWGRTEDLELTRSEERWITTANASKCITLDTNDIPHKVILDSAEEGQVLSPDTIYEARLVPLLLHEDFAESAQGGSAKGPAGKLGRWQVVDQGANGGPSHWEVGAEGIPLAHFITQTSAIWGGAVAPQDPVKPGSLLRFANTASLPDTHHEQPSLWTDYRLSAYLRSSDDGAIGVVVRYSDTGHYYRFSMCRQGKYRRLTRVVLGVHTILAEDDFVYQTDRDYLITIEAIGTSLRVYQDGTLVFDVTDTMLPKGSIGLYCWDSTTARFSDVRVDDFRQQAPVVYQFKFTTSQYTNFFHHLHSYQDETWSINLPAGQPSAASIATLVATSVALGTSPSETETRNYESLAKLVFAATASQTPSHLQIAQVVIDVTPFALLVQSPEPIDWKRSALEVFHNKRRLTQAELPKEIKLTSLSRGTSQPNEESVEILLREATDLTGSRIEYRQLPGPLAEPTEDASLFLDEFDQNAGLLLRETFGPNALDHYTIVEEGGNLTSSLWTVFDGHLVQAGNLYGGNVAASSTDKPGTIALTGSSAWSDVVIRAQFRAESDGALGLVFRYQDAKNYYRFSMDGTSRRLVKCSGGNLTLLWKPTTIPLGMPVNTPLGISLAGNTKVVASKTVVLWEDQFASIRGQSYQLTVMAYDGQLLGFLDNALMFNVYDDDIQAGRVGWYSWNHIGTGEELQLTTMKLAARDLKDIGAHFEALDVESLESAPTLWKPTFADLSEVIATDDVDTAGGPSQWSTAQGALIQTSSIHGQSATLYLQPGTYALAGKQEWKDVSISVKLHSDAATPIGVMFRVQDNEHYYRFSLGDHESEPFRHFYRRLIKRVGNTVTILWQDNGPYTPGETYDLTLHVVGNELTGCLNGSPIFTETDYDEPLTHGQVAFYCHDNPSTNFAHPLVIDLTRRIGRWTVHDETTLQKPSIWRMRGGVLAQIGVASGALTTSANPAAPGTFVIAGDPTWTDYRLIARLRSDDDDAIGLIFRFKDDDNYYRLSLNAKLNERRLVKKENGVLTTLWTKPGGFLAGEPFTLTVDAIGSRLVGYLDDTSLFDVNDTTHGAGQIGVFCRENDGLRIERVEVRRPPLEAYAIWCDRFASGDMSEWAILDLGNVGGPSHWEVIDGELCQRSNILSPPIDRDSLPKLGTQAVVGKTAWSDYIYTVRLRSLDDDAVGMLFRYSDPNNYYRFSMDSQRGYRRLVKNTNGVFSLLWEDDAAYEAGRSYEITITAIGSTLRGYLDGVPMFVVEDEDLSAGCVGLDCWGNHDVRFSHVSVYPADLVFNDWLLDEPFDFLITDRWTFVNESAQRTRSHWKVDAGELRYIGGTSRSRSHRTTRDTTATYALAGKPNWKDYRASLRLRLDKGDTIGVIFRYIDEQNYYLFSMRHGGRRLIKKVAGATTVLWQDTVPCILGNDYLVTIDCVGEQLSGYINGIQLFSLQDEALAAGRIGPYCSSNANIGVAEVRVAAPVWLPYYTFDQEEILPAGTRLEVLAGNKSDAPQKKPGIAQRFMARLQERGRIRLQSHRVDLRVRAPLGEVGHARSFFPDDTYEDVTKAAHILRKADGTAFFLFVSQSTALNSELSSGHYRLELTYRRDNRASDSESIVFKQAGESDPEIVILDVPEISTNVLDSSS
jgi:hypothetical protein